MRDPLYLEPTQQPEAMPSFDRFPKIRIATHVVSRRPITKKISCVVAIQRTVAHPFMRNVEAREIEVVGARLRRRIHRLAL